MESDLLLSHPNHNDPPYNNDIGLIRLKKGIQYSDKIKPIEYSINEELPDNATLVLTGWGRLSVRKLFSRENILLKKCDVKNHYSFC